MAFSKMQIFIASHAPTAAIEVCAIDTVEAVKIQLEKVNGIPAAAQQLSFQGKILDDLCNLADYDVCNLATVEMNVAVLGGFS